MQDKLYKPACVIYAVHYIYEHFISNLVSAQIKAV